MTISRQYLNETNKEKIIKWIVVILAQYATGQSKFKLQLTIDLDLRCHDIMSHYLLILCMMFHV